MSADLFTPAAQSDKGITAKSVEEGARVYAKGKAKAKVVVWDPANPVDSVVEGERQLEELLKALEAEDLPEPVALDGEPVDVGPEARPEP